MQDSHLASKQLLELLFIVSGNTLAGVRIGIGIGKRVVCGRRRRARRYKVRSFDVGQYEGAVINNDGFVVEDELMNILGRRSRICERDESVLRMQLESRSMAHLLHLQSTHRHRYWLILRLSSCVYSACRRTRRCYSFLDRSLVEAKHTDILSDSGGVGVTTYSSNSSNPERDSEPWVVVDSFGCVSTRDHRDCACDGEQLHRVHRVNFG